MAKQWRNESARKVIQERAAINNVNGMLPRAERMAVPPRARDQMRINLQQGKLMASRVIKSTWLLSGLFIRAGITKAP